MIKKFLDKLVLMFKNGYVKLKKEKFYLKSVFSFILIKLGDKVFDNIFEQIRKIFLN